MKSELPPEFVTVDVPTLVIWAEDDIALPVVAARRARARVPRMRLVRVPGRDPLDRPRAAGDVAAEIERELAA